MVTVGTSDLKNHLGRYLRNVRKGQQVRVTSRGRAVARLVAEPSEHSAPTLGERFAMLAAEGLIDPPTRPLRKKLPLPQALQGKPLSEIVIEERR